MIEGAFYSPPSWFKHRFIDIGILSCVFFPAYRRHRMRDKPIYKFLDVKTGEVIYYDNLKDYKNAIYNRIPEKMPNLRGYFFKRYEFDFRDRAYSNYLSYEPFFLRTRNWLTFNNHRSRSRQHFSLRTKINKFSTGTKKRALLSQRRSKKQKRARRTFWGRMHPSWNNHQRAVKREIGIGAKYYEEPAIGVMQQREVSKPQVPNPNLFSKKRRFWSATAWDTMGTKMMGNIGLEYNKQGPSTSASNSNLDEILNADPDYYRRMQTERIERIDGDRKAFVKGR